MKKQQITLVQTKANLKEYFEMTKNNQLPLVVTFNDDSDLASALEKLRDKTEIDYDKKNLSLSSIETLSTLYNRHYGNKKEVCLFLNSYETRKLIEQNKIYINKFIDSNNNIRYVDYIYPGIHVESTGGIVFRDKPRIFGKDKDYYITLFSAIPYDVDSKEFWDLCLEAEEAAVEAYEKIKK